MCVCCFMPAIPALERQSRRVVGSSPVLVMKSRFKIITKQNQKISDYWIKKKTKKQKNKPTNKSTQKSVHVIFCVLKLKGKNSGVYHSLVFSWSFQSNVLWCYDNLKYRLRDLTVSPLMIVSLPLLMKTNILDIYINGMWWEGVAKDQRTQVCASLPPTILAHTPLPWDITDDLNRMSAAQKGRPGPFAWPLFPLPG